MATTTKSRRRTGNADQPRDSEGRFETDHHLRNTAIAAGVAVAGAAAGITAAFKFGLLDNLLRRIADEGHSAEDLLIENADGARPTDRAPEAFRPDIDATMSAAEREALRPPEGFPTMTQPESTGFAPTGA